MVGGTLGGVGWPAIKVVIEPLIWKISCQTESSPIFQINGPSKIEWDLTNGPLTKLLELLDTKV